MNDNQLLFSFERENDLPEAVTKRQGIVRRACANVADLFKREALQLIDHSAVQQKSQPEQAAQLDAQVVAMPTLQNEVDNSALDIEAIRKDIQAA